MIDTALGRHIEFARPEKPWNTMSWVPDRASPNASTKLVCSRQPARYMWREPSISVALSDKRRVQPVTSANIVADHKTRLWSICISMAILGIATVITPGSSADITVIAVTVSITKALWPLVSSDSASLVASGVADVRADIRACWCDAWKQRYCSNSRWSSRQR